MTDRIVRTAEAEKLSGLCNVHLMRLEARGEFPPRFKLAENSGPYGAVGWRLSDIEAWIERRAASACVTTIILLVVTYGDIFVRAAA